MIKLQGELEQIQAIYKLAMNCGIETIDDFIFFITREGCKTQFELVSKLNRHWLELHQIDEG